MTRDASTDLARGIAIIAIVVGHVLLGLAGAGIIPSDSSTYLFWDRLLGTFHIAVFAVLSGLFVRAAVERMGRRRFIRHRVVHFLWLYLLWSLLQGAFEVVGSELKNTPASIADIAQLWVPRSQLWFLPFLIEMTILVALVRPWRSRTRAIITTGLTGVLSVVLWGVNGPYVGTIGLGIAVYFVIAAVLGAEKVLHYLHAMRPAVLLAVAGAGAIVLVGLVGFTGALPPGVTADHRTVLGVALGVTAATAGVIAVLATSRLLALVPRASAWLGIAGSHSLEIFLGHMIAGAGARIALLLVGVTDPTVHIVVGILVGVTLPLFVGWVCRVIRFPWLFDAPRVLAGE